MTSIKKRIEKLEKSNYSQQEIRAIGQVIGRYEDTNCPYQENCKENIKFEGNELIKWGVLHCDTCKIQH